MNPKKSYLDNGNPRYVIKDKIVYKYRNKHNDYIKLSPWKIGEDRRVEVSLLNKCNSVIVEKARQLVNKQWNEFEDSWTFNNRRYKKGLSFNNYEYGECISLEPNHMFSFYVHSYWNGHQKRIETWKCFLGYYKGRIFKVHWLPWKYGNVCHLYEMNKIAETICQYKSVKSKHVYTIVDVDTNEII